MIAIMVTQMQKKVENEVETGLDVCRLGIPCCTVPRLLNPKPSLRLSQNTMEPPTGSSTNECAEKEALGSV